ncbi:HNH endonuclease signature motif containing protein [Corynebacterium sp. Q4381]|uniref:HNH endonuclease signature motif containing protein n=1 Tax=Corynebacterium sp. Marseille-Q4381 TaxID=3121597 RepID=UPI002FE5F60F
MTPFASMIAALTVDALEGFDRGAALAAGISSSTAGDWEAVHNAYFGPTRYVRLQRQAVSLARAGRFPLDQLVLIEKKLKLVADAAERAALRVELLQSRRSYKYLQQRAKELVPVEEKPYKKQASFTRSRCGTRGFHIGSDERRLADLEHRLREGLDPGQPAGPQMEEKFWSLFENSGGGIAPAAPQPCVLVPLDKHVAILQGAGDDTELMLTDGTSITGAQYLALHHACDLQVALFHPEHGAVNLYRTQRRANTKQRTLAALVSPGCAVPGCRLPADHCETHHVTAWKHGGETNISNLAVLCSYHNRINNDDPDDASPGWQKRRRRAGRIVMNRGGPAYRTWTGHLLPANRPGAMELLFGPRVPAG